MKQNDFCSGNAGQCHHLTFQISTKSHWAFSRYEPLKIGLVSLFIFLSRCESYYKIQVHYPIPLKFGTLKDRIKAHPDTKFGCNTINGKQLFTKNNANMLSHLQG